MEFWSSMANGKSEGDDATIQHRPPRPLAAMRLKAADFILAVLSTPAGLVTASDFLVADHAVNHKQQHCADHREDETGSFAIVIPAHHPPQPAG